MYSRMTVNANKAASAITGDETTRFILHTNATMSELNCHGISLSQISAFELTADERSYVPFDSITPEILEAARNEQSATLVAAGMRLERGERLSERRFPLDVFVVRQVLLATGERLGSTIDDSTELCRKFIDEKIQPPIKDLMDQFLEEHWETGPAVWEYARVIHKGVIQRAFDYIARVNELRKQPMTEENLAELEKSGQDAIEGAKRTEDDVAKMKARLSEYKKRSNHACMTGSLDREMKRRIVSDIVEAKRALNMDLPVGGIKFEESPLRVSKRVRNQDAEFAGL